MDLQTAYYIIGIIFMTIMLILLLALVIAVFVIRAKVVAIHKQIQEKIDEATAIASKSGEIIGNVGSQVAKTLFNKTKKATNR